MGIISSLAGLTGLVRSAGGVAEAFVGNRAELESAEHQEFIATLAQLSKEFEQPSYSWFDSLINGLNRLPRPALAVGTLGLFVYAMVDPISFAERMVGLELVPEPLWWLLGAIVSFYFGAREMHYFREKRPHIDVDALRNVARRRAVIGEMRPDQGDPKLLAAQIGAAPVSPNANPALEEWRRLHA